jgi:hypothetical protein
MLGKFKKEDWFMPLFAHTSMHGVATLIIALMFGLNPLLSIILGLFDTIVHSIIDRQKVIFSAKYDKNKDKEFWWWLGVDQTMHHLTHYFIIFLILTSDEYMSKIVYNFIGFT